MYGRPAVIAALQSLLGHPHAIGVTDGQAALEASTGADLTTYFNGWVFGSGWPDWPAATVTTDALDGGQVSVGVTLATSDGVPRGAAVTVRLQGPDGGQLDVPFNFGPNADPQPPQIVTPWGSPVTSIQVHPENRALIFPGVLQSRNRRTQAIPGLGCGFPEDGRSSAPGLSCPDRCSSRRRGPCGWSHRPPARCRGRR